MNLSVGARLLGISLFVCFVFYANSQTAASLSYYSDPAVSPDGSEIAFVSGGDIWTVPVAGGEARLLISNPATESRPLYAPDGKWLAFNSTRTGNGDVYLMEMQTGVITRLTYDDGADELSAWAPDGKQLYFSSLSRDISGMRDVFRVKATGGTPMLVADNRYVSEFQAAPAPDDKTIAFVARGVGSQQWWRNGRSHLDESEIWLLKEGATPAYTKLAERGARQLWPMWSPEGQKLYYVSDRSGKENLWEHSIGGAAKQLTSFDSGRVLWPSIAANGKSIVFERDFAIWHYNVGSGQAKKVPITLRGAAAAPPIERAQLNNGFRSLVLSPDGKKIGFIVHGELFVAAAKDGGEATRITTTAAPESQPIWSANSNALYYVSERGKAAHLYQYNIITSIETQLTNGTLDDAAPLLSPDGKWLAFIRNGQELRTLELATGKEIGLTKGYLGRPPFASTGSVAWSPDGKWLAFAAFGAKSLRNIYVVPATGGGSKPVSYLGNTFGGSVHWMPDGKSILFPTGQRTEMGYVAKVDLVPQQPKFREDQFRELFVDNAPVVPASKTGAPAAKQTSLDSLTAKQAKAAKGTEPVRIVWEGLRSRLSLLPLGADVQDIAVSRDGTTLILIAVAAEQPNLYAYSLDELSRDAGVLTQLTFTKGSKSDLQLSADGKEVFYLETGRINSLNIESKVSKPLAVTATMNIDFAKEKMVMFQQAWEIQQKGFYDESFHGKNWQSIRAAYEPYAAGARTPDELRRILNLMVGELNASHSGVSGPATPTATASVTGRSGLRFHRASYEKDGHFKISEVIDFSPAALSEKISVGDYLIAIDGKTLTPTDNIDSLLENKVNRKVVLSIGTSPSGSKPLSVTIRPVNLATEKGLLYKQWVQEQRAYVAKKSGGRLGYVHMFDMSQGSLDQLYLDMDAENHAREGVVVDVRNNNGGFVNAYALDVFSRKGYMSMTVRGLPTAPARVQLGQRALDAPTILVTNQHSLSDAEDFTEGYRALGLGKIVGEPTAGWIIYTSAAQLIDGSSIRLPFIKVTDNKGNNMELSSRPVDIAVSNPLGTDKDLQLDTAVSELLKELDIAKK